MFSLEQMKDFVRKQRVVKWNAEYPTTPDEAKEFYSLWLLLVEQLIDEGYDDNAGDFCKTAEKLRVVIENPPAKISFKYPFTGEGRDVTHIMDMLSFFHKLHAVCIIKEVELQKS